MWKRVQRQMQDGRHADVLLCVDLHVARLPAGGVERGPARGLYLGIEVVPEVRRNSYPKRCAVSGRERGSREDLQEQARVIRIARERAERVERRVAVDVA